MCEALQRAVNDLPSLPDFCRNECERLKSGACGSACQELKDAVQPDCPCTYDDIKSAVEDVCQCDSQTGGSIHVCGVQGDQKPQCYKIDRSMVPDLKDHPFYTTAAACLAQPCDRSNAIELVLSGSDCFRDGSTKDSIFSCVKRSSQSTDVGKDAAAEPVATSAPAAVPKDRTMGMAFTDQTGMNKDHTSCGQVMNGALEAAALVSVPKRTWQMPYMDSLLDYSNFSNEQIKGGTSVHFCCVLGECQLTAAPNGSPQCEAIRSADQVPAARARCEATC